MLGFDALGALALGQAAGQGASTIVLVANAGAYTVAGNALVFRGALALAAGTYVVTGTAAGGASSLRASAGAYGLAGSAASFPATLSAAAGGYAVAGQPAAIRGVMVASGGAYVIAPRAAPLRPSLAAQGGAYGLTGFGTRAPVVMRAKAGAYLLTPGVVTLTRTGGAFDQVYGGIGHYREELERLRQLARITRPAPRPIVHAMRPRLRPLPMPAAAREPGPSDLHMRRLQAMHLQAMNRQATAARHLADQAAQRQAAIARRRRQEAEILLLAC